MAKKHGSANRQGGTATLEHRATQGGGIDTGLLKAMEWRCIGPFRGGRVVAVAGDPVHPQVFYFGSTGGGVWKTTDGGVYWQNVSDGAFARASVGALAVAPSDPNVLYAGMGEATIRGNVSHGDGVYRSTDAGHTWQPVGLAATRHIGRVRIHPQQPELVYVAALGHAHGPNPERGIFRSRDGGATWEAVLAHSADVGASDLALDPTNPRLLYAALWRARRLPHALESGGEGCGLWKSRDGGDTWTELTHKPGLPTGTLGKIGVTVSPARAGRVWAIVEAEDGGVFRSDDGGEHWERLSEERELRSRPWYYMHIHADPQDPEIVWVLNVRAFKSIDGGRTFFKVAIPHGDNHDLWIDPRDPNRMIQGNDGGASVSFNGGETWSSLYNQPTAEFYHVTTDQQTPYRVYGAQQDNTTISVPSRARMAAITVADYVEIGGGESGYVAVRPDDPNIIYAGSYQGYLTRYDHRTGQRRDITVWPEGSMGWPAQDLKYRFQWTYPIVLSPHDPTVLYVTGNHVFRSTDEGSSWEVISPDLTRNDPSRLGSSGGPVTKDNVGTEYYGTIFAFAESPRARGLFWAGSDDGRVHLSRDAGASWQDVTPPALPAWALISLLEPSPHDPAVAYLAATRYKLDDFAPYLFKTADYGQHWTAITSGLPPEECTRAIRADPTRQGLVYAGTEAGIYVSFDDGAHWQSLRLNLPVVPVHDLVVKDGDLVVATHGRSFWILDDLTPLYQLTDAVRRAPAHLFQPRPTIRFAGDDGHGAPPVPGVNYQHAGVGGAAYREVTRPDGEKERLYLDAGRNPHDGVYITYSLRTEPADDVKLTILDAAGTEIRSFSSAERKQPISIAGDLRSSTADVPRDKPEPKVPKRAGLNRFYWDMRYPSALPVEGYVTRSGVVSGPSAPPGTYQAQLTVGDQTYTQSFEIHVDPRVPVAQADLEAQFALLMQIRDKITETHAAITTLQNIRRQVEEWEWRVSGQPDHEDVTRAARSIVEQLGPIEDELMTVAAREDDDTLRYPIKLNIKLAELFGVVSSADAAPTRQACEVYADLAARVDVQLQRLRNVVEGDVAAFDVLVRDVRMPAIVATSEPPARRGAPTFSG